MTLLLGVSLGIVLLGAAIIRGRKWAETPEQRAAQDAPAQQLLASIVLNSQDAIWGKSLDGTITSWNEGAERLFGYKAAEVVGRPSSVLTPEDRLADSSGGFVRQPNPEHYETMGKRKDQSLVHVSISRSPVRDAAGVVIGSSTIARDITRQKRAEEELRRAEERLRDADRRKDEFLAVLAHELRNPLAPLRNALEVLKQPDVTDTQAQEARDIAERQVHHLARLVDDLLDVSRITHGRIALKKERVELRTAVTRALETALPGIEAQGHELSVTLPEEPVWLEADVVRLAQVLANLLNNAAQYTTAGGKIALRATRRNGSVEIGVTDTGIGIAKEALPRIFDLFAQASPLDARAPTSLGIGLRLVKELVQMHGGRVEARSPGPGLGSSFVVTLPAAAPLEPRPADAGRAHTSVARRILVVDDNTDAATSLAVLLRLAGHETCVAHSGTEALRAFAEQRPEIVLLDIGMPGMDGYEVARRIREAQASAPVTLVALTGWGQQHDRARAKDAGFDHHLTKPVEPAVLHEVIARAGAAS